MDLKKRRKDYKGINKVCKFCHKVYSDVVQRRLKYCSLKCWKLDRANKHIYKCLHCGKGWKTTPGRNTKYCSRKCMFEDWTGKKRPEWIGEKITLAKLYGNKPSEGKRIRHLVAWSRCRKKALKRDCFTCQMCFGSGLEVHHIKPTRTNPEIAYDINNLITLCKKCHVKTYSKEKKMEKLFYKRLGMA